MSEKEVNSGVLRDHTREGRKDTGPGRGEAGCDAVREENAAGPAESSQLEGRVGAFLPPSPHGSHRGKWLQNKQTHQWSNQTELSREAP